MDQAKLIEFVTEEERSVQIVRVSDCRIFTVVERKTGIEID
jgi:hypothetical protein